jgi:hypothetical protein
MVLISLIGWADPRAIVRLKGLGRLTNPVTSWEIEPATFRIILLLLINYAIATPPV